MQQSTTIFSISKSTVQNVQFNFLMSEAQRNFRYGLFGFVKVQHISAIAESHFRTKLNSGAPYMWK